MHKASQKVVLFLAYLQIEQEKITSKHIHPKWNLKLLIVHIT